MLIKPKWLSPAVAETLTRTKNLNEKKNIRKTNLVVVVVVFFDNGSWVSPASLNCLLAFCPYTTLPLGFFLQFDV